MSRTTRRVLLGVGLVVAFLALLNPGYSSVSVSGPQGVVKTEKYSFGPGRLFVYTRVVADDQELVIEQQ